MAGVVQVDHGPEELEELGGHVSDGGAFAAAEQLRVPAGLHHVGVAGEGVVAGAGRRPPAAGPGPGSLTWRCASDTRGVLLAPAALILQVAHPVVGAGVFEHSTFRTDPWVRLARTVRSVNRLVFASAPTAAAESQ